MSLRCYFGLCTRSSDQLTAGLPASIAEFESWILRQKLNRTLQDLLNQSSYHAYLTMMRISSDLDLSSVWNEYVHYPAPQFLPGSSRSHRRARPVQNGETSFVYYGTLPGGFVEHVVRPDISALANITRPAHVLYPGYIIRWLGRQSDGTVISYTLGRGVGLFAEINENKGAEMFMELDKNIIASLAKQQSRVR